jgi:hypothetical protein
MMETKAIESLIERMEAVGDKYDHEHAVAASSQLNALTGKLTKLQAIAQAAEAFVNADGRGDPQGKYRALKAAVEAYKKGA